MKRAAIFTLIIMCVFLLNSAWAQEKKELTRAEQNKIINDYHKTVLADADALIKHVEAKGDDYDAKKVKQYIIDLDRNIEAAAEHHTVVRSIKIKVSKNINVDKPAAAAKEIEASHNVIADHHVKADREINDLKKDIKASKKIAASKIIKNAKAIVDHITKAQVEHDGLWIQKKSKK
ncbi:hypothetical protein ACFL27_05535 [candidate division CSSED10-310 bacterium]|uniref:DUF4142 domain-containing protein n=1 Tax=candidate division CSSED10-310 bacterium TaxID=2855610 RepID=A0ABV6YTX3_UNCC1